MQKALHPRMLAVMLVVLLALTACMKKSAEQKADQVTVPKENAMIENRPVSEDNEALFEVIEPEDDPLTDVLELRATVLEGMIESVFFRLTDFIKAAN